MSETKTGKAELNRERLILSDELDSVELRQMTVEDASDYFMLVDADREHLSQFGDLTAKKYLTLKDVEISVTNQEGEQYRFGIWDNEKMVGFMKLKRNPEGDLETGSWVGKQYTGNNYAARARRLILQYAFGALGAPRVVSKVKVGNEASRKSVESSGYHMIDERDGEWFMVIERVQGAVNGN
jgi:RimJ/RimL family protein N-acetyltransferase